MLRPAPVLLMVRALGLGGSERQLTETVRFLDRGRFEPHVACLVAEGVRRAELDAAGAPVLPIPMASFGSPAAVRGAWNLASYIRKHRIQIVHTFDVPMNVFGLLPARLARTPVVLSSQRAHRSLTTPAFRRVLRLLDRVVDGVVVNCEAMREHLVVEEGTRPDRIHVCYNGIDTGVYYPAPVERPGILKSGIVIGVLCALRPEKGLETLVRAFSAMHREFPDIKLLIVGSGTEKKPLEQLARELGVAPHCHFEPGTREVAKWLRCMDIFVLPSLSEALSNALMEAMACGCCPVASRVGGNPELVIPHQTGLLFEPGDVDGLAAELRLLLTNDELRRTLAESAADRIHREFTHRAASERMSAIYESMLAQAG